MIVTSLKVFTFTFSFMFTCYVAMTPGALAPRRRAARPGARVRVAPAQRVWAGVKGWV